MTNMNKVLQIFLKTDRELIFLEEFKKNILFNEYSLKEKIQL